LKKHALCCRLPFASAQDADGCAMRPNRQMQTWMEDTPTYSP
jgi:hypothetical protein